MLIGKTSEQRHEDRRKEFQELLKLMVPHKRFALFPVSVNNGQTAWLCNVWRVAYNYSAYNTKYYLKYDYFIDYERALAFSRSMNYNASDVGEVVEYGRVNLYK